MMFTNIDGIPGIYIPSTPPSSRCIPDEFWTNGRTDCAPLLLFPSKAGRTNPVVIVGQEVLVENSSADPMHHDWDWYITLCTWMTMLTASSLGKSRYFCPFVSQDQCIKWWNCYSHYLSKLCLHMNVSQNSDLMRYLEPSRFSQAQLTVYQPEICLWFFATPPFEATHTGTRIPLTLCWSLS